MNRWTVMLTLIFAATPAGGKGIDLNQPGGPGYAPPSVYVVTVPGPIWWQLRISTRWNYLD